MKQNKIAILLFPFLLLNISEATTLKEAVETALAKNPEVLSIQKNSEAYRYYIDEEEAGYYPTIDLDIFLENKKEIKNPKDSDQTTVNKSGYNAQIQLEQILFDGGLTDAKVDEATADYQKTKIANIFTIENIINEAVQAYLDIVKYKELLILSENNLKIHENYLSVAKESEDVSGETLDRIQVESKLFLATSKLFQQKNDNDNSLHSFYKLVGFEPKGNICRPILDKMLIPESLEDAKLDSLKNSFTILEQIENIKVQRAVISQEKSRFLPTLKFQLTEEFDDDLDTKDSKSNSTSAKLLLSYNLFNGFKDTSSQQRERIFLQESQQTLDDTLAVVEEDIKSSYSDFQNSVDKITYLKLYVEKNKEILTVYKEQFSGGTRTFIDILNSEAELFNAKTQLIEEEYSLYKSYYEILLILSKLSDTIVLQDNQICEEIVVDLEPKQEEKAEKDSSEDLSELEDLLAEDGKQTETSDTKALDILEEEAKKEQVVKDLVADILSDIYKIKKSDIEIESSLDENSEGLDTNTQAPTIQAPTNSEEQEDEKLDVLEIEETDESIEEKDSIETEKTKKDAPIEETTNTNELKSLEEPIKPFINRLLENNENAYTINLMSFSTKKEAEEFVNQHDVLDDIFIYKFGEKLNYVKLINGIYDTSISANNALDFIKEKTGLGLFTVESINTHKELYSKYNINYTVPKTKPVVEHILEEEAPVISEDETSSESEVLEVIITNKEAKAQFLNAKENTYVINVTTFNSIKDLYTFVEETSFAKETFAFRFKHNSKLIKVVYGNYASKVDAKADLEKINSLENINAIIQNALDLQKLYGLERIEDEKIEELEIQTEIPTVVEESVQVIINNEDISNEEINNDADVESDIKDETGTEVEINMEVETEAPEFDEVSLDVTEEKTVEQTNSEEETSLEIKTKNSEPMSEKEILKTAEILENSLTETDISEELDVNNQLDEDSILENEEVLLKEENEQNNENIDSSDSLSIQENEVEELNPITNRKEEVNTKFAEVSSEELGETALTEQEIKEIPVVIEKTVEALATIETMDDKPIVDKSSEKTMSVSQSVLTQVSNDVNEESKPSSLSIIQNNDMDNELALEFDVKESSKYTIMVLNFKDTIRAKKYANRYALGNHSLTFAFEDKIKLIHGVYDSFEEANEAKAILHPFVLTTHPYVRKIKSYQELYKKYNTSDKNILKEKESTQIEKQEIPEEKRRVTEEVNEVKILNVSLPEETQTIFSKNKAMKDEFLTKNSSKYTITLATLENFEVSNAFSNRHQIVENTLSYKYKNSVRVIYGIFNSSKEAKVAIEYMDKKIKKNKPFVNKLNTHQKLYIKYNKNIEDEL